MVGYEGQVRDFCHYQSPENLMTLVTSQKELITEVVKSMSNKVDRIEFSQIIQNKANTVEVQKLMQELIRAKSFNEFQKNEIMQNILNETASSH